MPGSRRLKLRRSDKCVACEIGLPVGAVAFWDAEAKTVTCLECLAGADVQGPRGGLGKTEVALDRGVPGASARRRYEHLHAKREHRAREKFGSLGGGVYFALTSDPQSTVAWGQGSRGERLLGEFLEKIHDERVVVMLHDRRMPGTRANIDHIALTRSGVIWVIDTKKYSGKVRRIDRGGWFSTDLRLYVGRRDCTKLVHKMAKQLHAIRTALGEAAIHEFNVDIRAALCFVDAEWPLLAKPFELGSVWIGWPRTLRDQVTREGDLGPEDLRRLARSVATALPPA